MNRRMAALILALIIGVVFFVVPASADSTTIYAIDASWHTGRVYEDLTCWDGYLRIRDDNANGRGEVGGWARFDTSSVPDAATITNVRLYFYVYEFDGVGPYIDFNEVEHDPVYSSCAQTWPDITDGTTYVDNYYIYDTGWWDIDLGASGAQDLENLLAQDWFAVGFAHDDTPSYWAHIRGHDDSNRPYIVVTYEVSTPPAPDLYSVSGVPSSVQVGQSFTVQVTAENDGGTSQEGAINASVLYSDGTDDVTIDNESASWADWTIVNYAPGEGPLYDNNCNQIPGGAIDHVVEAADNDWDQGERYTLSFRVTPHKAGTLWVRVRTTMKDVGTCNYINDHSVDGDGTDTDQQGWAVERFTVTVNPANSPPTINLTQPSGDITACQGDNVLIQWTDSDPDDNASISLAYDVDNDPANQSGHTWIVEGLSEDPDGSGDQYNWDTSSVPPDTYYVWGMIYDTHNPEVYDSAPGRVTIVIGTPDIRVEPASLTFSAQSGGLAGGMPDALASGWPADAQSTTGPVPPPGIERGRILMAQAEVVLLGVPAYIWHNGCGPTAAGMVIGYWDGNGFDNLVSGSADTQTAEVNAMVSSSGNYDDYCLPIDSPPDLLPDRSEPPEGDEHADDCVADLMETSQSAYSNYYGWSWFSHVDDALQGYVDMVAPEYSATSENQTWGTFTWDSYRAEIDANRPVVFLVDTDANGSTDHFVTAIGYSDESGTNMYACRDTWDTGVHWFEFAQVASGQPWGIYGATLFQIEGSGLTIFNDGCADLEINNIYVLNSSCWLSVTPPQSLPFTIAPGESAVVGVGMDSSCVGVGTYNDYIRIRSNDPDEDPLDVPVELQVLESPRPDLVVSQPQPSASPPFHVGQNVDWSVTTTNQGNEDAQATHVGYYLGTSCSDLSNRVNGDLVDPLPSGASEDDHDAYTFQPGDVGTPRYMIAWADYQNEEPDESDENNNTSCYGPFEVLPTYSLTVTVTPNGSGSVSADPLPNAEGGKYIADTQVQLTANPASGYNFSHWSGDASGSANPTTITMDGDKSVIANFTQPCYSLSTSVNPSGSGSVSADPPPNCGGGQYTVGTQVQLTANPASGCNFSYWSGGASGSVNPTTITMDGDKSVTANFNCGGCNDPHEPNDTWGQATPIAYDTTLAESDICPAGDVDYYSFSGSAGDTIIADIDAQAIGSSLDSYLYLYDTDGVTELTHNDDYDSLDSRITYVLPADGIYYLMVREYSHPNAGGGSYFYTISLSLVPPPFDVVAKWTLSAPTIDGQISAGEWDDANIYDITVHGVGSLGGQEEVSPDGMTLPESLLQEKRQGQTSLVPRAQQLAVILYAMNDGEHLYLAIDDSNDTTVHDHDQMGVYFDDNPLPSDGQWTNTSCGNSDGEGNFWVVYLHPDDQVQYREIVAGPTFCDSVIPAPGTLGELGYDSGHAQAEIAIDLTSSALRAMAGDVINMYLWIFDDGTSSLHGQWPSGAVYDDPSTYGRLILETQTGDIYLPIILRNYP